MGGSRGGAGGPPRGESQEYRVYLQYWSGSLEKSQSYQASIGPSSVRQRNAISMAIRWLADDGPFIAVFGSSNPAPSTKTNQIWTPLTKLCVLSTFTIILKRKIELAALL